MSHESRPAFETDDSFRQIGIGVLAGLVAGLTRPLAGSTITDVGIAPVELHHATGAFASLAAGLHLVYSVLFGVVFVAAIAWTPLARHVTTRPRTVLAALAYGVVLWFVNVAVGWPLVQTLFGLGVHEVPHLHPGPLVVHVLYGVVLGAIVAVPTR